MKILVIEDDKGIRTFVSKGLQEAGFTVDTASDGEDGFTLLLTGSYDAAVVDIMLPGMDGLQIIEKIRSRGNHTPIIILSAKRDVDDKIQGLQKGGDDYLTKPFSFSELLVRIQALIRRSSTTSPAAVLSCSDLTLSLISHKVERKGIEIELQPKEFALLEYLLQNKNRVLSKTLIMEKIWHYDFDPQTNIVDVLVSRLRSKIDKNYDKKLLHTIRGVGYVIKE